MVRVPINPDLIEWACERAGVDIDVLQKRFPKLAEWQCGKTFPTMKQLEGFAKATHASVGYFFLPDPPNETVPIEDFRTIRDETLIRPSPNLLDTIYICQQRQDWYREYALMTGEPPSPLAGCATIADDVIATAAGLRDALAFDVDERREMRTWVDAFRQFLEQAENLGVMVMVSGVVGSNNRRKLDPGEFRGFALCDPLAPLVFVNGADTKAAQMFTLAHELAHLLLGETGLSDVEPRSLPTHAVEKWCNRVAAELLVPLSVLKAEYSSEEGLHGELDRLARVFKVSTLVVLRRLYDGGLIAQDLYWTQYEDELNRLQSMSRRSSGGDFYLTTASRVSRRFARAVVTSTWEGRSSFTEAFRLLGFKKMSTFKELGQSVGVAI